MSSILTGVQRRPFEWIEIDQPLCSHVFGDSPCAAILGTTGLDKCFNTRATCQSVNNYDPSDTLTLRFCHNQGNMPDDNIYFPFLESVSITPSKINPAGGNSNVSGLGLRSTITATFSDYPHTDLLVDPYREDRDYIAYERSTFWAKWRARNPYYLHRVIRHKSGYLDENGAVDADTLITRTFFITGFSGLTADGSVSIAGKDVLTLAANEKAKAPTANTGKLLADLAAGVTTATLTPAGIGNTEYAASGSVRIGGEVMTFTRAGDVLTLTRGTNNTADVDHNAGDVVQECLVYTSQQPHEIIYDLLTVYASVDPIYLDYANWVIEATDYLPRLYSAIITQPMGVAELLTEISEQMGLTLYWDDRAALLKLRAIRPAENDTITPLTDDANLLESSVNFTDKTDDLITEVWIYYAQRDPTQTIDEPNNYGALEIITDPESESSTRNGVVKIKTIFSRWLSSTDGDAAVELGDTILARYSNIPREFVFSLDAKDGALWISDFVTLTTRNVVDSYGLTYPLNLMITSAQESLQGTTFTYSAQEYLLPDYAREYDYTIDIADDLVNVNLWELFNEKYAAVPVSGDKIKFTIRQGVNISTRSYAEDSYTSTMLVRSVEDASDAYLDVEKTVILPYITRHAIGAARSFYYADVDVYTDPDTAAAVGIVNCDVFEVPAGVAITTGEEDPTGATGWKTGVLLYIENLGTIAGEGGSGGAHTLAFNVSDAIRAGDGGHALQVDFPVSIINQGIIAGGGGGGEISSYITPLYTYWSDYNQFLRMGQNNGAGGGGAGGAYISETSYKYSIAVDGFIAINKPSQDNRLVTATETGINITQASGGDSESNGYGAVLKYTNFKLDGDNVQYLINDTTVSGGNGGALGSDGSAATITKYYTQTGVTIDESNNYEKYGRAGYAIKSGANLVTWINKGDVRGLEF